MSRGDIRSSPYETQVRSSTAGDAMQTRHEKANRGSARPAWQVPICWRSSWS